MNWQEIMYIHNKIIYKQKNEFHRTQVQLIYILPITVNNDGMNLK